jgi:hypothetical protein
VRRCTGFFCSGLAGGYQKTLLRLAREISIKPVSSTIAAEKTSRTSAMVKPKGISGV